MRFGEVAKVDSFFCCTVELLKELGFDRKEGNLQLVLARSRPHLDIVVGVDWKVLQELGVAQRRQFYFHWEQQ